ARDLVPDRRRAERHQLGRSNRVRGAAVACRDPRGARGGVRVVGPTPAAGSRRERAPGSGRERAPDSARSLRSRGEQAAAGAERDAGAAGLRRTAAGAGTRSPPSAPAALVSFQLFGTNRRTGIVVTKELIRRRGTRREKLERH